MTGRGADAEGVTEAEGELFKFDDAAGFGHLVNAVDGGDAEAFKPAGDALVGGEHELFNETISPGALGFGDAAHLAVLVELNDGLGEIEVDAAAFIADFVHELGEACA